MRRAIAKHGKDFGAILGLALIATIVAGYILAHQRLRFPWEGKPFEDKGQVVEVKPEKSLVVTHWSPLSGVSDIPENYHTVRYEIVPANGNTRVTIRQDNNVDEQEREHSAQLWKTVLENMKKMLEEK